MSNEQLATLHRQRSTMSGRTRFIIQHSLLIIVALFLTACGLDLDNPPRLATATAQSEIGPTATAVPLYLPAPTATAVAPADGSDINSEPNPILTVWINETSPEHTELLEGMMAEFSDSRNINVELVQVSSRLLPDLMATAVLSDTLPDIVLHPMAYTMGWADRGILSTAVTNEIIDQIGRDTFNQDVLALFEINGEMAGLPSDGYQQLIIYRQDWFDERNLDPPDNYAAMLAGAEAIYDREALRSGFVIPTESNLVGTHEAFEHIALANDCQLIDAQGEVRLLDDACREALDFYYNIVHQFSPIGVQTNTSARNAYLDGRTGLIMFSPSILPQMAGLDPQRAPSCSECERTPDYLAQNSGILTAVSGNEGTTPAHFGNITNLGVTAVADPDIAAQFADYWFNEGYPQWLAIESERKVPLRNGTADQPRLFIDNWGTQPLFADEPSLQDVYGEETIIALRDNIAATPRWTFAEGQSSLLTSVYEELTFSIVLQEMLSGYFTPDKTVLEALNRVVEQIPGYSFPIPDAIPEIELTPEAE